MFRGFGLDRNYVEYWGISVYKGLGIHGVLRSVYKIKSFEVFQSLRLQDFGFRV